MEEKTRLQLIEEALQNARTKADLMAKTSSVIIAGIVKIGYNESDSNIKYTRSFNKYDEEEIPDEKGLKSDVTSLLHVEEIEVVESVSVIYKIKDGR